MLAKLLKQNHRQQAGAAPAAWGHVERRGRLADRLAVTAGELLPHVLDHFPTARDHFQRLRHILAQVDEALTAAAQAAARWWLDDPLARQMRGDWPAGWTRAGIQAPAGQRSRGA